MIKMSHSFLSVFISIVSLFSLTWKEISFTELKTLSNQDEICNKKVKYSISKVLVLQNNKELLRQFDILIDPLEKKIITSAPNGEGFSSVLTEIDCKLSSDMKVGYAIYRGYVPQKSGSNSPIQLRVEVRNDSVLISRTNPSIKDHVANSVFVVERWQIVKM